jgi:hypothetical protein
VVHIQHSGNHTTQRISISSKAKVLASTKQDCYMRPGLHLPKQKTNLHQHDCFFMSDKRKKKKVSKELKKKKKS